MSHPTDEKRLRGFGLLIGSVFCVIGVWPVLFRAQPMRLWAIMVGVLLVILGIIRPSLLRAIYEIWMKMGHVMGWINTRVLLAVVFYGLITPIGMVLRWIGHDPMNNTCADESATYRVTRKARTRGHMKYQF